MRNKIGLTIVLTVSIYAFVFVSGCMEETNVSKITEVPATEIKNTNTSLDDGLFNETANEASTNNDSIPQMSNTTSIKLEKPPFTE